MKRFLSVISVFMVIAFLLGTVSCDDVSEKVNDPTAPSYSSEVSKNDASQTTSSQTTDSQAAASQTTASATTSDKSPVKCDSCSYDETVEKPAKTFEEGVMRYICKTCGDSYTEAIPATKSIKILAVGNSFSINAMEYLWDICKAGGVEEIILGNLYISGCTLQTHLNNINSGEGVYDYYLNVAGKWVKTPNVSIKTALSQTDWDVITVQQSSTNSGKESTFTPLEKIVSYLRANVENPDVEIYWHMTWAYQSDFTNNLFAKYDYSQKNMYDSIINAVKNNVAKRKYIDGVIPAGTAIQNLRTSYFGDTLTRDGYHLNYEEGYYTAALTWFAYITGGSVDDVDWTPSAYPGLADHLAVMREAVVSAVKKPYEVTQSSYTEAPKLEVDWTEPSVPDLDYDPNDTDADRFEKLGLDINDYELLDWDAKMNSLYSSTGGTKRHDSSSSTLAPYYISSKRLYKTDLPVGSVIIVDKGFQYRPEGWESESYKATSATREKNVLASVVTVDTSWWKNYEFRGFNLSPEGTREREVVESDIEHLRIYVPKAK